ncbi:hypothetical protein LJ753_16695 [Arthrobacter sp. zg-Y20]|uniref:hypothetical protein n=1 Tax=unclassified Arthrobacter TaxID=235627 RepID=UPI001D138A97|nr:MULTISPECIES: hypothetical protein [unclassified Arthrobacter]MCC3277504.1 hypothetical protein [Arthrobacter sp. zg-Y20]MDK1317664.1 hypothetical protein [Arthrobacter sp. zg.Y20]WIB07076.1 hypothetical protein QNO06_04930 [Arthrobacter sp. zg-Y20]
MSTLDDIKARAAGAAEARLKLINAEDESQEKALSISAAFIAEQSSYDVPKLVAALEAVQQLAEEAMSESAYLLPGGYPSKPVEARLILTMISEALA